MKTRRKHKKIFNDNDILNNKGILISAKFRKRKKPKSNLFFNYIFEQNIKILSIKTIFLIGLIIVLSFLITKNINNYNFEATYITEFPKKRNKTKVKYSTNSTLNKGFLEVNTTHKGKFTYYDYTTNIKVYKDLFKDVTYIPITEKNYLLPQKLISNEEYYKICEDKVLLDKTKYKRNKNPKISVVIPYYNRGNQSIIMTLRSIQNQSLKDIEIIIVDDVSIEDGSKEIFDAMKDDNRIIFLKHIERKSTLLTRVDGIRYASGEYIIQVDQDDMFLTNLLFETLYNKSKELDVDIVQFNHYSNDNKNVLSLQRNPMPANVIIKQPRLRTAFFAGGGNHLLYCAIRMIWNLFVRRTTYLEAIDDLGDEYMNHIFRLYEDTLMMLELSQVAYSYYFFESINGYLHCTFDNSRHHIKNETIEKEILAMNQLLFMKFMLLKIDPKCDRYHVYRELGFGQCDKDVKHLNRNDFDLGLEVVEIVYELERMYKNTNPQLISCIDKIKKYYII